MHFIPEFGLPSSVDPRAKTLIFSGDNIILCQPGQGAALYLHTLPTKEEMRAQCFLGQCEGIPLYATEVLPTFARDTLQVLPLRVLLGDVDEAWFRLLCRGKQILNWHQAIGYCSTCGGKAEFSRTELAKQCVQCQRIIYIHYAPAVLVLVQKENEILLARSHHFRTQVYSLLAGYLEPGETAEQAAQREVEEEVGIKIKQLQFFGTEHWPFPDSFMIAYTAQYDGGEIKINTREIEDARWFKRDALPLLPYKSSLSRQLIDRVVYNLA